MTEECRLYGVNLEELAETLGSGDANYLGELGRRYGARILELERDLTPGAVAEALRRWIYDPVAQVGETAAGAALGAAFEILCGDAARRASAPMRLCGDHPIPPVAAMADDVEALDVSLDFDRLESRLGARKTCGVVFQTPGLRVGHLSYLELRRVRAALKAVSKELLQELPFFAGLLPAVRLAVRHELDLIVISG
ncbi:MAG: hypothetical protein HY906_28200 [Deltaproteobacteria bacterium]|nr:hypothetical protein [Deltaproteobacteria bacterium]